MLASRTTELRGYENPYAEAVCAVMSLQDDRRANFMAWMDASGLNMNQVSEISGVQYNTIRSYVVETKGKRTGSLSGENEARIAGAFNLAVEDIFGALPGNDAPVNHLAAWRAFAFMTAAELAEKVGVPTSTIEFLESAPTPPSDKWLRRLGPAFDVQPGFIRDYDPNDIGADALDVIRATLKPAEVKRAERTKRTGTEG